HEDTACALGFPPPHEIGGGVGRVRDVQPVRVDRVRLGHPRYLRFDESRAGQIQVTLLSDEPHVPAVEPVRRDDLSSEPGGEACHGHTPPTGPRWRYGRAERRSMPRGSWRLR